ncbi:MAG: hypothetical protein IPG50_17535 [Myxococcales bacterium]|nr:hypothetical protein [Myxococcales bacterium]
MTSSYGQNFARDKTGAWFAWGNNFATNLAIATPGGVPRATPTFVEPAGGAGSRIVAVAPSAFTTCVLTAAGGVKCVGANQSWDSLPMGAGMLGSGSTDPALQVATLVDVVGLERGVTELVAGSESFCAKKADGAILCWGQNLWEQGDGGVESDLFIGELGAGLLATTGLAVPVPVVGFPE